MTKSTKLALRGLAFGLFMGSMVVPALVITGCERTESSTKTKTEKIVETPEGPKKVTETTETKKTTDPK